MSIVSPGSVQPGPAVRVPKDMHFPLNHSKVRVINSREHQQLTHSRGHSQLIGFFEKRRLLAVGIPGNSPARSVEEVH
jgi:hypothetical protein